MRSQKTFLLILALLFCLVSCAPATTPEPKHEVRDLASIVILPVQPDYEPGGKEKKKNQKLADGAEMLDQLLEEYFAENSKIRLISRNQSETLASDFTGGGAALYRHIGGKLEADGIMHVMLYSFQDREGTDYSAVQPASISFEYKLFHVPTGEILCSGMFDETQQALLQNILSFSFKKGIRWMTGKEFARYGLEKKLQGCDYLRAR